MPLWGAGVEYALSALSDEAVWDAVAGEKASSDPKTSLEPDTSLEPEASFEPDASSDYAADLEGVPISIHSSSD